MEVEHPAGLRGELAACCEDAAWALAALEVSFIRGGMEEAEERQREGDQSCTSYVWKT